MSRQLYEYPDQKNADCNRLQLIDFQKYRNVRTVSSQNIHMLSVVFGITADRCESVPEAYIESV